MSNFRSVAVAVFAALCPAISVAQSGSVPCGEVYQVAPGDTLSRISIKAYGTSAFEVVYDANRATIGDNPNRLLVGQEIIIPCRAEPAAAEVAEPEPAVQPVVIQDEPEVVEAAVVEQEAPPAPEPAEPAVMPVVLTFNKTSDPRFVINRDIIDPFLNDIEMATEGRVLFVDPPVMNRDAQAQFDLVTSGTVDATYVLNTYIADTHPLLQLPMFPLMGGSAQQTAVSFWNLHDAYLSKSNYFEDAHILGFVAAPAAHIWQRSEDVVTAGEDILSQNAYAVPYFLGLDTLGPQRVQERTAEVFGSIDEDEVGTLTFMMAHGAARGAGIWTPERAVTEVENGIYTPVFSVLMSNEAWARIDPRDQDIITNLSGLAFAQRSAKWDDFDNAHRAAMLEAGLTVRYPDDALFAELQAASEAKLAVWQRTAANLGIPAAEAIASYRADLQSLQYLLIFR